MQFGTTPSPFVAKHARRIAQCAPGLVVDVAGGNGRNAACVAQYGVDVICLDHDRDVLDEVGRTPTAGPGMGAVRARYLDLLTDQWPYGVESLGAIVCVHWPFQVLLGEFATSLKRGGYLLLETFGGHGDNWVNLPHNGEIQAAISTFDLVECKERRAGPVGSDRVTAKVCAVKQ